MRYVYRGPGPSVDPEGELVHPLDEREFPEEPAWGPWEPLEAPEPPAPARKPAPAKAPAAAAPLTAADPKGM
jgi:hypothetical protein